MKRLFKYLVAAATSFSLLIANVPLTSMVVRADVNYPYLTNANDELKFHLNESDVFDTTYNTKDVIVDPGYIDVDLVESNAIKTLVISLDGDAVYTQSGAGVFNYELKVKATIDSISVAEDVGTLALVTYDDSTVIDDVVDDVPQQKITIEVASTVTRMLDFKIVEGENTSTYQLEVRGTPGLEAFKATGEVDRMPNKLIIENPGGMGVEELGRLTEVIINDVPQQVTARYDRCEYSLEGIEGDKITIVLNGDNTPGGVIEWTNYDCPAEHRQGNISEEEQFKYGSAKVVGVYAEDDTNFENNIMADYGIDEKGCIYDEYGNGALRLENGYWIAFEFIPLPGYQLVEFGGSAGGQDMMIGTNDRPNVYYFQMPQSNVHFSATFDTPENIVRINGESIVDDGSVTVAEDEFAGGTAKLTVGALSNNDQAAYNQDNAFAAELNDGNLEVQEYLSLDLANIYQKANTEDYWEEEYHNLEKGDATVTLKVGDDFNPDNKMVYIVHDKGDAGYETLEAEYDPNTHEITFWTGSFSNFMIATSDEENDIDVDQNNNNNNNDDGGPEINDDEPEEYVPRYSLTVIDDEPALGNWEEGEDHPFFDAVRIGRAIPGNAEIANDLPDDLPEECKIIYFINGEEVESFSAIERKTFSPGHFVTYDGLKVTEFTFEVYFTECWIVGIDVDMLDLSMKVLDKDGKELKPLDEGDLIFECGNADEVDFTYFEIAFAEHPAEVVVKGINGYSIFWLESIGEDVLDTPIGENHIKYPADDDYTWISAWGYAPDSQTVGFAESLKSASAVFEGVSEEKAKDYMLVVSEFDTADAPAEDVATVKKQLEDKGYTAATFPLGFEVTLFDKNGSVHEPGFTVKVTLVLKEALALKDGETVLIIHVLDEGFEVLEAVYNATDLTLTFETKTFSPFVVTIATKTAPASVVKTGEDVNTTRIVIATLLISAAAAAGILFIKRRRDEAEKEEISDPTF